MKKLGLIFLPILIVALFMVTSLGAEPSQEPILDPIQKPIDITALPDPLPVVGSFENLKDLLQTAETSRYNMRSGLAFDGSFAEGAMPEAIAADSMLKSTEKAASPASGGTGDYSQTNVQVKGVDEADIVKTDGKYIYQIGQNQLTVVRANPPQQMELMFKLPFNRETYQPLEMYVDDENLIVIGYSYVRMKPKGEKYNDPTPPDAQTLLPPGKYPPVITKQTTKALIFDINDKHNITKIREIEIEGGYLSSRKIGSSIYLVTNKYADVYHILRTESIEGEPQAVEQQAAPTYRDSLLGEHFVEIGYDKIHYFPGAIEPNYLILATLNLEKKDEEVKVSTYLGAGNSLYSSHSNLYIAVPEYEFAQQPEPLLPKKKATEQGIPTEPRLMTPPKVNTAIYKFRLEKDSTTYMGKGQVPGRILNQFAMDEYDRYFRIATTIDVLNADRQFTTQNNLYILDSKLKLTGKIEDIAPGERIYSTRFMGDRGYMVTFKTVDPLFVLDLKDPRKPEILGELKIPGYSDYLHPYDENHVIGFGKDAIEMQSPWSGSKESMAFYQGMKVALFDITDVNHPIEKFAIKIGDRGTESELLHNHKALLFSKEKNLLAFPISVAEVKDNVKEPGVPDELRYGQITFQGAYVFNLTLEKGFDLKGRITHMTAQDLANFYTGYHPYPRNRFVERILTIDDNLYTVSQGKIMAHGLSSFEERGEFQIPENPQEEEPVNIYLETLKGK